MSKSNKDWSMNEEAMNFILQKLSKKKKTILEIGSGRSTEKLSKFFTVTSIEENINWVGKYNAEYIYAPIKNNWYDIDVLKENNLSKKKFDIIIIDGPAYGKRMGFLKNLNFFDIKNSIIIVDDIERKEDTALLKNIIEIKKQLNGVASWTAIHNVAFVR
tara:strand:+ start:15847 stop:16326 length:480 start_codon:yes stop_codon:yes gene_type:complete